MNVTQLQTELMHSISQIDGLTKEYEEEERRFTKLQWSFERLQSKNPFSKYGSLKKMIQVSTEDCLRDY